MTPPQSGLPPQVSPGTKVSLVLGDGSHAPAIVTRVLKSNRVNLKFDHREEVDVEIHSSPYDPTGKQPDSWHLMPAGVTCALGMIRCPLRK